MAIPADVQKGIIKKRISGKSGKAKIDILRNSLEELAGYKSGPYAELRK